MKNKKEKKTLINRIFSKDEDEDIKKLKELTKKVRRRKREKQIKKYLKKELELI